MAEGHTFAGACLTLAGSLYVLLTAFSRVLEDQHSRHHTALTACDILLITVIVWLTGAVQSEYYLLYCLPAIIAVLRLDTRTGITASLLAGSLYIFVVMVAEPRHIVVTTTPVRVLTVCVAATVLMVFFAVLKREVQLHDSLREAMHSSLSRIAAIYDVAHAANVGKDLGDLLSILLDHAARGTRAEHGSISLLNRDGHLQPLASLCPRPGAFPVEFPPEPAHQALASGCPVTLAPDRQSRAAIQDGHRCLLYLPLKTPAGPIGVLALASQPGRRFTRSHLEFLGSLCSEAAITVENVQLRSELRRLAVTDPLTGLLNRREIEQLLLAEAERAHRYHRPLALLMIDVDNLKVINDERGHAAGDELLCALGQMLQTALRASDSAGRIGGDEFMVILPETNAAQAAALAGRLIDIFAAKLRTLAPLRGPSKTLGLVGLSIGVADTEELEASIQELVARADAALYQAKRAGKNCSRIAHPTPQHIAARTREGEPITL